MPNYTTTGLEISDITSHGGMNHPQSLNLNIMEAVWDHLDIERNKRQPTNLAEPFLKTALGLVEEGSGFVEA